MTPALAVFKQAVSEVNDFYWGARAGFDALRRLRPPQAKRPADFLEPTIAGHLNVDLQEFERRLDEQPRRLHYLTLVDVVTFYEEFMLQTLIRELPTRPTYDPTKSVEKQAKGSSTALTKPDPRISTQRSSSTSSLRDPSTS
jgi:hypothetical protein